jgi:hypothetical protein
MMPRITPTASILALTVGTLLAIALVVTDAPVWAFAVGGGAASAVLVPALLAGEPPYGHSAHSADPSATAESEEEPGGALSA